MIVNLEKKWGSFALNYAKEVHEKDIQEWTKHYSQILLLTSNVFLSCIVTHITEFKLKAKEFNQKKFMKELQSFKYKDIKNLLNFCVMDFMMVLIERQEIRDELAKYSISDSAFEEELFNAFSFTDNDKRIYYKFKPISGTLEHSSHLVSLLGLKDESTNEGMILGIEFFKKAFFDKLKSHLSKALNPTASASTELDNN